MSPSELRAIIAPGEQCVLCDEAEGEEAATPPSSPPPPPPPQPPQRSALLGLHTCGDLAATLLRLYDRAGARSAARPVHDTSTTRPGLACRRQARRSAASSTSAAATCSCPRRGAMRRPLARASSLRESGRCSKGGERLSSARHARHRPGHVRDMSETRLVGPPPSPPSTRQTSQPQGRPPQAQPAASAALAPPSPRRATACPRRLRLLCRRSRASR